VSSEGLDPSVYNAFVDDLEIGGIELVKIHGERMAPGAATQTRFNLTASYMQEGPLIHYRYEVTAHFVDGHAAVLGNASASIQVAVRTEIAVNTACTVLNSSAEHQAR